MATTTVTRVRLREAHDLATLATIYDAPHDHTKWDDHVLRVDVTVNLAMWLMRDQRDYELADLSCGDADVATRVYAGDQPRCARTWLGDLAPGYQFTGPIEQTIKEIPSVDLFLLNETLEHLDDPDLVLRLVRDKAERVVLSTPVDERGTTNVEHYWGWGVEDLRDMLRQAGWQPVIWQQLAFRDYGYTFQLWGCE